MAYINRYTGAYPSDAELMKIEGMKIIDLVPPGSIQALGSGTVAVVGEFLKEGVHGNAGSVNVNTPLEVTSSAEMASNFGGWSNFSNPGGASYPPGLVPTTYDGNGFLAVKNKKFSRLVLVNVEQSVGTCTLTVVATGDGVAAGTAPGFTIPAGTRVQNSAGVDVFALVEDVIILPGLTTATPAGSYVAGTPNTATVTLVKMRRVLGTALTPTADSVVASDAAAIFAINGLTPYVASPTLLAMDCTLFSTVTAWSEAIAEAAYSAGINSLLTGGNPANQVNVVVAARHTQNIMGYLKSHVIEASSGGRGRIACFSPPLGTVKATARGATTVGVGNSTISRSDRCIYCYPGITMLVPEIPAATISAGLSPTVTWASDVTVASVLSQLSEEYNPGWGGASQYMSYVTGVESAVGALTAADYVLFKAAGIAAPIIDPVNGCQIQSGVNSVDPVAMFSSKNIARRRMADKIQDDLANGLVSFLKGLNTPTNRRCAGAMARSYLDGLLSEDNPSKQRIAAYSIDEVSGNTAAGIAQGLFVMLITVQTISSMDYIVLQANIGETVTVEVL